MIILAVRCTVKPGKAEAFEKAVTEFIATVRANEPGCLGFQASRLTDQSDIYLLYEQYVDAAALDTHRAAPYFIEFSRHLLPELLDLRVRELYEWVAG